MGKKAKKMPKEREAHASTDPWEALPQQLCEAISNRYTISCDITYEGIAKSWRNIPKKCNPTEKPSTWSELYISQDQNTGNCIFALSSQSGVSPIPTWDDNVPFMNTASLLQSQICTIFTKENCVLMVATGISKPAFVLYKRTSPWERLYSTYMQHHPEEHKWIKQYCTLIDPNSPSQRHMQFTNVIGFNGNFYALSLQGTVVVAEEVDSRLIIIDVSTSRAVPSVFSRHFVEYLIELNGEIVLVFLISTKFSTIVDNVEIFKLQLPSLKWKKVEKIGDRAVFISQNRCESVIASKVGCRGNCVFFAHREVDGWRVFDMEKGSISPCSDEDDFLARGSA